VRFRTAFLILVYVLLVLLLIPFLLLCMLVGTRDPLVAIGKWAMRLSRRILGIPLDVRGLENVLARGSYPRASTAEVDPRAKPGAPTGAGGRSEAPAPAAVDRSRPLIIMANHLSFLDGPLLFMLLPQPVRVIMKKGIGRIPVLGPGMRFVGFLTVDRTGAREGKARIELAARLMRERGYSFLIFPEGTRSGDGDLGPFRRGGFFLALESGAPIVPVAIRGTYEMMPRGRWYVGKGRIRVDVLAPVPSAGTTVETMPELMEKVRSAITAGLEKGDA
jgi:1-acyl-sn-glycerol-3-phosphate acyltransferase